MSGTGSVDLLAPGQVAPIDAALAPTLLVVVDTEEEFDWSGPHDRASTTVAAMADIERLQRLFDARGVRPCYVVDYPVATQPEGYEPLLAIADRGGCVFGAHLHPWVTPPHEEIVNTYNSYPGNLPPALERTKLEHLSAAITAFSGEAPTVYKAGRYGVGPATTATLLECGFRVDLSPTPAFAYVGEGGPRFWQHPNRPFWFGPDDRLLCIPCTGEVVGMLGSAGRLAHRVAQWPALRRLRAGGVLARLRLAERIRLSPEGFTLDELIRVTRYLLARGVRVLTLSFHSPSARPGCTPYVTSESELEQFQTRIARYLDYFFDEAGGVGSTPLEVLGALRPAAGDDVQAPAD